MLITLSRRTAICQSVSEVYLTSVVPLGAVSHRFNFDFNRNKKTKTTRDFAGVNEIKLERILILMLAKTALYSV